MSLDSLGTTIGSPSSTGSLAQALTSRIDANSDGQISTTEFAGFLTKLLDSVGGGNATRRQLAAALAEPTPAHPTDTSAPADVLPSTWTDNNAPYGVTLAGFSPQNHTDLTLADLGVPGKAEKYAAYHYLLSNRIQPTNDWAPRAADALNRKYNTTVYHAIDGETLGFGNEYIHSAPNGYGMARGTYNPSATGEFFWGNV
jgi:hypothetical protein